MSYQIESIAPFDGAVKRLAKKYRRIKQDLRGLLDVLGENPFVGDAIPGFATRSGKSGWQVAICKAESVAAIG